MAEQRRTGTTRIWHAPAAVAAVAAAGYAIYNHSSATVADVAIYFYAASLILGPSFIYPWMRSRGAAVGQAALGSLSVPLLWLAKEMYAVARIFRLTEALYYALNPLSLGLFTAAALQIAVAELILRRVRRGRWELANGAGAVVLVIAALGLTYAVAVQRNDPTILFWVYIEGYRRIFGG